MDLIERSSQFEKERAALNEKTQKTREKINKIYSEIEEKRREVDRLRSEEQDFRIEVSSLSQQIPELKLRTLMRIPRATPSELEGAKKELAVAEVELEKRIAWRKEIDLYVIPELRNQVQQLKSEVDALMFDLNEREAKFAIHVGDTKWNPWNPLNQH